ncbi:MAG: pyruvate kinase alpha/beta domain-containing protein [Candidatus Bathyarchaeia archaeon]
MKVSVNDMGKVVREDYYFDEPGKENTEHVVEAVVKRVEETGIRDVVVASTSGETALRFAKALRGKAKVYCVTESPYRRELELGDWPCLKPELRKELVSLGVVVIDNVLYPFHSSVMDGSRWNTVFPDLIVKEVLYSFSQGIKVAVEVVLAAVSYGYLEPYKDVIGVGGTGEGADSAAIIRGTYPGLLFSKDEGKRLEIREIIAMPRRKKWWS